MTQKITLTAQWKEKEKSCSTEENYKICELTLTNLSDEILENPEITFSIPKDWKCTKPNGFNLSQNNTEIKGKLEEKLQTILPNEKVTFSIQINLVEDLENPQLPTDFKINGEDCNVNLTANEVVLEPNTTNSKVSIDNLNIIETSDAKSFNLNLKLDNETSLTKEMYSKTSSLPQSEEIIFLKPLTVEWKEISKNKGSLIFHYTPPEENLRNIQIKFKAENDLIYRNKNQEEISLTTQYVSAPLSTNVDYPEKLEHLQVPRKIISLKDVKKTSEDEGTATMSYKDKNQEEISLPTKYVSAPLSTLEILPKQKDRPNDIEFIINVDSMKEQKEIPSLKNVKITCEDEGKKSMLYMGSNIAVITSNSDKDTMHEDSSLGKGAGESDEPSIQISGNITIIE